MGEEGMENLERKFARGREPLKTRGAEQVPPSPIISFHVWSLVVIYFPFPLPRGLGGMPRSSAGT